jgi:hypothetical protein
MVRKATWSLWNKSEDVQMIHCEEMITISRRSDRDRSAAKISSQYERTDAIFGELHTEAF